MAMLKHTHSADILFSSEEPRQTFTQDNSFYSPTRGNISTNSNYSRENSFLLNPPAARSQPYTKPIDRNPRRNKDDYTEITKLVPSHFGNKRDNVRLNASFEERDFYGGKHMLKDNNANYRTQNGVAFDYYNYRKPSNGYGNNDLASKAYMSDNEGTNEFNRYRRSIPTLPGGVPRSKSGGAPHQNFVQPESGNCFSHNTTTAHPYVPPPPYSKTNKTNIDYPNIKNYSTSYSNNHLDQVEEDVYTVPHTFNHQKVPRQASSGPTQNPYPPPPRRPYSEFNIIDDARRRTWSPPMFNRLLENGVTFSTMRSYKSNDQLDDVAAELPAGSEDHRENLSGPPRLAPVSGKLEQNAHQSLIKPIAFKPVVLPCTTQQHYGASPTQGSFRDRGPASPHHQQQQFQQPESPQQRPNNSYDPMRAKTLSPYELKSSTMPTSSGSYETSSSSHVLSPSTPKTLTFDAQHQGNNIKAATATSLSQHKQSHHPHHSHDDGYISQDYHSGFHCHSNSSHSNTSHGSLHNDSIEHSISYMNNSVSRPSDRPESLNSSNVSRLSSQHNGDGYTSVHTPSPSDSGVGELEAILREKDATIQHLRDTMEKNETAILQVCAEKERLWELELREINMEWERRWRHHQQKAFKMEQALLLQLFKLQQERKALKLDIEKFKGDKEDVELKFNDCHEELKQTKTKLDEVNWEVCQKSGEISLLKSQLKDSQDETSVKRNEIVSTKTQLKSFQKTSDEKDHEILTLEAELKRKNGDFARISLEVSDLKKSLETVQKEAFNAQQKADLKELQLEMKTKELEKFHLDQAKFNLAKSSPVNSCSNNHKFTAGLLNNNNTPSVSSNSSNSSNSLPRTNGPLLNNSIASPNTSTNSGANDAVQRRIELEKVKADLGEDFKKEREQWLEEKNKVIRYQKHLQLNYVQMYRKNKVLESEVEQLTLELEKRDICLMDGEGGKIITEEESMC